MTGITRLHGRDELRQIGPRRRAAVPALPSRRRALHAGDAGHAARGLRPDPGAARAAGAGAAGAGRRAGARARESKSPSWCSSRRTTPATSNWDSSRQPMKPETWAIVGGRPDRVPGAPLNTPLVPASNFVLGTERLYSRTEATDTWEAFEAVLGGLEGGHAVSFSSGMAACAAVLSQLRTGAHLVIPDDCYQGVAGIAEAGARDHALDGRARPGARHRDVDRRSCSRPTSLWIESPTNPLLDVADVAAICAAPRRDGHAGRRRQHVRDAAAAAAAVARRRRRRPRRDEVPRRPLRPADGRGGRHRRGRSASC